MIGFSFYGKRKVYQNLLYLRCIKLDKLRRSLYRFRLNGKKIKQDKIVTGTDLIFLSKSKKQKKSQCPCSERFL